MPCVVISQLYFVAPLMTLPLSGMRRPSLLRQLTTSTAPFARHVLLKRWFYKHAAHDELAGVDDGAARRRCASQPLALTSVQNSPTLRSRLCSSRHLDVLAAFHSRGAFTDLAPWKRTVPLANCLKPRLR